MVSLRMGWGGGCLILGTKFLKKNLGVLSIQEVLQKWFLACIFDRYGVIFQLSLSFIIL